MCKIYNNITANAQNILRLFYQKELDYFGRLWYNLINECSDSINKKRYVQ
jgi:hypothetical protein